MSEVMVDFTTGGYHHHHQGGRESRSGASSTYTQSQFAADRSATEIVATDQQFSINREAYFSSSAETYHHQEHRES